VSLHPILVCLAGVKNNNSSITKSTGVKLRRMQNTFEKRKEKKGSFGTTKQNPICCQINSQSHLNAFAGQFGLDENTN
jgi:hypothetical protein